MLNPVEVLNEVLSDRKQKFEQGILEVQVEMLGDPQKALERFRDFGGEGWLCVAMENKIFRFYPYKALPEFSPNEWPVCGEAAKGDESLHIQRSATGWMLTTITRKASESENDLIIETLFKARNKSGDLRYETCWRVNSIMGLDELRPDSFRFAGFASKS